MRNYPQPGERWQHERGWMVIILSVLSRKKKISKFSHEFDYEVTYRYESDNQVTESPLPWFLEKYSYCQIRKVKDTPSGNTTRKRIPYSGWLTRKISDRPKSDQDNYSQYL